MGIFSFFEQIGNLITGLIDAVVFVIQSLVDFITTIVSGFTMMNMFVAYMPGELAVGFIIF